MGGFLFGNRARTQPTPPATNLRVQSSIFGRPQAIGAGQNRLSGNLIWYGDFTSRPAPQHGGKGGGGGGKGAQGQFEYSASFMISLGSGPVEAFTAIYNGNAIDFLFATGPYAPSVTVLADLAALGVTPTYGNTYAATFIYGDFGQTAWSYLASAHPTQALAYRGEVIAAFSNFFLGSSATVPPFGFELVWGLNSSAGSPSFDVNPADWINAFLTNADWGVPGFPAAILGDLTVFRTMCRAYGLFISPVVSESTAAQGHLLDLAKAAGCGFRYSQGILQVIPLVDLAATGGSVTYTPSIASVYDLLPQHFMDEGSGGNGPNRVSVNWKSLDKQLNQVRVEFLDRSNLYNPVIVYASDEADMVASNSTRISDVRSNHFFCFSDAAMVSAGLQLAMEKVLRTFSFKLPATYILLEVYDIVTITDPTKGLDRALVRITEIQENSDDRSLSFKAEDFTGAVGKFAWPYQKPRGTASNSSAPPGDVNTPIIFEPPQDIAVNEVWMAISGIDTANWGGCFVWISLDGTNYSQAPESAAGPARMGALIGASVTAPGRAVSGPTIDSTNTFHTDLTESAGILGASSHEDMLALTTLCIVDAELIAYETATLVATSKYDLNPTSRGAYGTTIATHAAGAPFARLDSTVVKHVYDPGLIGSLIYIKFQSINKWGGGAQDLAGLTPVTYTVVGNPPKTIPGGASSFTATGGVGTVALSAVAPPDALVAKAKFWIAAHGAAFSTAVAAGALVPVAASGTATLSYAHAAGTFDFFVTMENSAGADSPPRGPVVATIT